MPPATPLAQLRREDRLRLVATLVRGALPWTGDEGYRKAEVTGGGVGLAEVDPRTLESRRQAGLHICGEALDAFGPIGGYNFLWAWATGRAAGLSLAAAAPLYTCAPLLRADDGANTARSASSSLWREASPLAMRRQPVHLVFMTREGEGRDK